MKIHRSSKIYFTKWLTKKKVNILQEILTEYARAVNWFIETYEDEIPIKRLFDLTTAENIQYGIKELDTWLTARMMKNAFAEGYGMVRSYKSNLAKNKYIKKPVHAGKTMVLCQTIVTQYDAVKTKEFDFNVILRCVGNKLKISIPLKKHKQFNKWNELGKRSKSVVITNKYIMFSFKIETEKKKEEGELLGIDIGVRKLIATSKNEEIGSEYYALLKKLKNKKQGSNAWKRCKEEIKEYIDKSIKNMDWKALRLIVVEKLKNVKYKMKVKGRLTKNIRSVVSNWTYRYILTRLQLLSEENRVVFRSVPSYYTSIECPRCNHRDKGNRKNQESFLCLNCGYSDNADFNAAKNILIRFLTGTYGSCYKPSNIKEELGVL